MTNKKDERIRKLWDRGITDYSILARKIGYSGGSIQAGIERVVEALARLGYLNEVVKPKNI